MNSCTTLAALATLLPSLDQLKTGLSLVGSIVIGASLLVSLTPKPPAGTRLARLYRALELAALLFGHAKETGELRALPQFDSALQDAINLVREDHR
jgi:hypothetical protein